MYAKFFGFNSLAPNIKMSLVMFLAQVSMDTYHFSTASSLIPASRIRKMSVFDNCY
jgi:hypothetical protein